jgi:hypothetical protein
MQAIAGKQINHNKETIGDNVFCVVQPEARRQESTLQIS